MQISPQVRALAEIELRRRQAEAVQKRAEETATCISELWAPLPGPQTLAYHSLADVLFYGGAAGGGKSDLLLGLALTKHRRSIVFRREYPQIKALEDRSREIIRCRGQYNSTDKIWRLPLLDKQIEFGAVQHLYDEFKYQGRPHDLKAFDEITHLLEAQFRYLCGWLRSTDPAQRCRIVGAGNPPTDAQGDWVITYWAPWLDEHYPKPAQPGELRWFTTIDGKDIEVGPEPFMHKGELIVPLSRTFVPARVEDNPYYMQTGYKATLQALPEPLRSKMLEGSFAAGREDDPWQIIPTEWVKQAQERWRNCSKPSLPMTAIGADVARGGQDKTVLSPRHGNWFDEQKTYPGKATPDGPAVAGLILALRKDAAVVNVDVIGVGTSVYDHLKVPLGQASVPMNGAEGSEKTDKSGQLGFINQRAEWWWGLRESLDPASGQDLALPPDRELLADLCAPKWKLTARGIQVESKEEIIKRIGRSPDKGDSLVYAHAVKHVPGTGLLDYYAQLAAEKEREKLNG